MITRPSRPARSSGSDFCPFGRVPEGRPGSHAGLLFPTKADLFKILAADIDDVADLFHRYSYPDAGGNNRIAFVGELLKRSARSCEGMSSSQR